MVAGGVAAIVYGSPRLTFDVDLIVDFDVSNLRRLTAALAKTGFHPRLPVAPERLADPAQRRAWVRQKGMQVFAFIERRPPFRIVDILVQHTGTFVALYRRRLVVRVRGVALPLVPRDHLLRMKRIAGRPQDLEDIRFLS